MDELIPGYNQFIREFDIQEATLLLEQYGLEVCDPSAEDPPSIDVVMTNEIK